MVEKARDLPDQHLRHLSLGDGVPSDSCRSFGSELKQFSERSDLPTRSPGRQITGLGPKALLLLPAAGSEDA